MDIIVWHHKHGNSYYDASTPEKLEASGRQILHELIYDFQYIWKPDDEVDLRYSGIDMDQAELTDEQVDALPTTSLQDEANKHRKKLRRELAEHEHAKAAYALALKLVEGEDHYVTVRRRSKYSDDEWAEIVEKFPKKFTDAVIYEDRIDRKYTAWDYIRNERAGGEYEIFEIESVWSPDDEEEEESS